MNSWVWIIHWMLVDLLGTTLLWKTDFVLCFLSQQLSAINSYPARGEDSWWPLFPCSYFVWLDLVQVSYKLSQPLWVHVCNCVIVPRKYYFDDALSTTSGSYNLSSSLPCWPLSLGSAVYVIRMSHLRMSPLLTFILCTQQIMVSVLIAHQLHKRSFSDESWEIQ